MAASLRGEESDEMERGADSECLSSSSGGDSSEESDSSSELDGEECERRRTQVLETLSDLELQFSQLREQLYRERKSQIKRKLEEVQEGTAVEYRQPLQELQDNMRIRLEVANVLRQLRLENINKSYEAEEQAARQNFDNEKILLFDSMKEELEDRIRRLEEEESGRGGAGREVTTTARRDKVQTVQTRKRTGVSSGGGEGVSRRKPVTVSGPFIVYMLAEEDILEDWTVIKKALNKRHSDRMYT